LSPSRSLAHKWMCRREFGGRVGLITPISRRLRR
jgi:hypothetical protein